MDSSKCQSTQTIHSSDEDHKASVLIVGTCNSTYNFYKWIGSRLVYSLHNSQFHIVKMVVPKSRVEVVMQKAISI